MPRLSGAGRSRAARINQLGQSRVTAPPFRPAPLRNLEAARAQSRLSGRWAERTCVSINLANRASLPPSRAARPLKRRRGQRALCAVWGWLREVPVRVWVGARQLNFSGVRWELNNAPFPRSKAPLSSTSGFGCLEGSCGPSVVAGGREGSSGILPCKVDGL